MVTDLFGLHSQTLDWAFSCKGYHRVLPSLYSILNMLSSSVFFSLSSSQSTPSNFSHSSSLPSLSLSTLTCCTSFPGQSSWVPNGFKSISSSLVSTLTYNYKPFPLPPLYAVCPASLYYCLLPSSPTFSFPTPSFEYFTVLPHYTTQSPCPLSVVQRIHQTDSWQFLSALWLYLPSHFVTLHYYPEPFSIPS